MEAVCCSIWNTTSITASGRSVSPGERRLARFGLVAVQRDCRPAKRDGEGLGRGGTAVVAEVVLATAVLYIVAPTVMGSRSTPLCWAHSVSRFSAWAKAAVMRRFRSASEIWLWKGLAWRTRSVVASNWRALASCGLGLTAECK